MARKKDQPEVGSSKAPAGGKVAAVKKMVAEINKKFGDNTVVTGGSEVAKDLMTPRFFDIPSLEVKKILHCDGFAKIVEIYGPNSSGKTRFLMETIALNQKLDPNFWAAWVETEDSIQEQDMIDMGIDMDRIIYISQSECGSAERVMDIVRAILEDPTVDMVAINSLAGLCPAVEVVDDMGKANVAPIARLLSKFFRLTVSAIGKNKKCIVFINQVRTNIGQMYGDPMQSTGGVSLGFYASQRIRFNKVMVKDSDPITKEEGVKISVITTKNRFAGKNNPYTATDYYATYEHGIDSTIIIPSLLKESGVMRNAGAWWYYEDQNGQPLTIAGVECKFRSKGALLEVLYANEEFKKFFLDKINEASIVKSVSDEEMVQIQKEEAMINSFSVVDEEVRMEEEQAQKEEE